MSPTELAEFLGIANEPKRDKIIANISPAQMAVYERMKIACEDIEIWEQGGPRPKGIIMCHDHKHKRGSAK